MIISSTFLEPLMPLRRSKRNFQIFVFLSPGLSSGFAKSENASIGLLTGDIGDWSSEIGSSKEKKFFFVLLFLMSTMGGGQGHANFTGDANHGQVIRACKRLG